MVDLKRTLLPDRIFTREEAAEFIGRSADTLDGYVASGAVKPHLIGRTPEFLLSEIIAAFAADAFASTAPKAIPPRAGSATRFATKKGANNAK